MEIEDLKSPKIVPSLLYLAAVDDSLILGEGSPHRLMGVFLPTPRSLMYMDIPGKVCMNEGNISIKYITLQKFLSGLGKGDMDSIVLAYSHTHIESVLYMHPLWQKLIIGGLENLINFDLYGVSSILHKHLRHFEYTEDYINELKMLREEIQDFDKDDSISDIIDLIDWSHYKILRPYRIRRGESTHTTQGGIDLMGRKIQDVRVDVLIDRIDMDIGDYRRRNRDLTTDIIRRIYTALYIYGHLTFQRTLSFPLLPILRESLLHLEKHRSTECLRCLYMKFSFIDDIDIKDNFFYMHARQVIEAFYREIYGIRG